MSDRVVMGMVKALVRFGTALATAGAFIRCDQFSFFHIKDFLLIHNPLVQVALAHGFTSGFVHLRRRFKR